LKKLNPSGVDFEIRSLSLENDMKQFSQFLQAIEWQLSLSRDFELVEAWLNVFLKVKKMITT